MLAQSGNVGFATATVYGFANFISALIGKIPVSTTAGSKPLTQWYIDPNSNKFAASSSDPYVRKHDALVLPAGGGTPAAKWESYLTRVNGQLGIAVNYKELIYDSVSGTWGDDGKLVTTDNDSTFTDTNGKTGRIGTKLFLLPYFIRDSA